MSKILSLLSGAGAILAAVAGFFFYAKGKGKEEARNEANKQIIDNIEKRHKIDVDVDNTNIDDLRDELRDPNNKD